MTRAPLRYFDYAATCPPYPEALDACARAAREFYGNPSSLHEAGLEARRRLEELKNEFGAACGFRDGRVILTSGGTEANNLVLRGVLEKNPKGRLLLAADAHASAWFAVERYAGRVDVLRPGAAGILDPERLVRALTPRTVLCSVAHAVNESGRVHDVAALAAACARKGVLCHCDGVQALGHLPVDLAGIRADFYTFSAHKFGGPRGAGGVLLRSDRLEPQTYGGPQEGNLRAGTENLPGLAGAVEALRLSLAGLPQEGPRLRALASALVERVRDRLPDVRVNSDLLEGLPGLVSLSFEGLDGHALAAELNLLGFALSTGAACHEYRKEPARAILALGRSPAEALGTIRMSMGRQTTGAEVDDLARTLPDVVERQRALA